MRTLHYRMFIRVFITTLRSSLLSYPPETQSAQNLAVPGESVVYVTEATATKSVFRAVLASYAVQDTVPTWMTVLTCMITPAYMFA